LFPVDQGSFAQHETAAPVTGAAVVGELHHVLNVAENPLRSSNMAQNLLDAIKTFFKDNPTWE
jgi:hypothetical protein